MAVNTDETTSEEPDVPDANLDEEMESAPQPPVDTVILQELKDSESERKAIRMVPRLPEGLDKVTFGVAGAFALAFVIWGLVNTASLSAASNVALSWVTENTGWFFVSLASFFVVFVLWLALGRYGNIPLGRDGEKPEFRTVSWIAMMFSAGMGIGLMFYGVASRSTTTSPRRPGTVDGTHPRSHPDGHGHVHLPLEPPPVGHVRRGRHRDRLRHLPAGPPAADLLRLHPLFGSGGDGPAGKIINILAIFATLFGTAASLGLGALQIGSGLSSTAGSARSAPRSWSVIIAVLTVCFVPPRCPASAGIQWLSNINMVLALAAGVIRLRRRARRCSS